MTEFDKPDKRVKHGMAKKHPLYGRWIGMRQRCADKNHVAYDRYGAIGITVCQRWDNFDVFVKDMPGFTAGMSIERVDGALGYSPENCIWATSATQSRNRSMTVWLEFSGQVKCLSDWASDLNICFATLKERIQKWGIEKALTTPRQINGKKISKEWKKHAAI